MKRTPTTDEAASLLTMIATGLVALAIGKVRHRLDANDQDADDDPALDDTDTSADEVRIPIE